jgi:two-component system, OmpR family, alkaline phosphatase synthesis response regulator PhoP
MGQAEKKRILLVDDEEDIVSMLKMRLAAGGYEVIVASDGNDGYAKAKAERPDLMILDLMLPGMDGYQICRLLKFDQQYKNIPIVMLTAKSQKEDKEWGEKVGADLYFTKPFDAKELMDKIKTLLGA